MALATEKQKNKMDELGILYDETTTIEEAREAILDHIPRPKEVKKINVKDIDSSNLLENSDWED